MTAITMLSRGSPTTAPLPSLLATPPTGSSVITLPRLQLANDAARPAYHSLRHREELARPEIFASGVKPLGSAASPSFLSMNGSPSSPASFSENPQPKFGLAHLLEAAQHCHSLSTSDVHNPTRKRSLSGDAITQSQSPLENMSAIKSRLHSIDYLINGPSEEEHPAKRARPNLSLDANLTYHYSTPSVAHQYQHSPQAAYIQEHYEAVTPVYQDNTPSYMHITPNGSQDEVSSQTGSYVDTKNVWETVLTTGTFPDDICLSENPSCCSKPSEAMGNPVKQGRWTNDEKEFAENLIQQVRNGEVSLPPNMSLRKFIAESLQCKAMRVSKKFRSLRACQSPDGSTEERKFNPLSLHSIMNDDADLDSLEDEIEAASPKQSSKTLKRSDYSQHGAVRSGRWSVEEENYAKAMIEAFKNGYLPLHGNVSLRKFLSEVLVCHPMRISKKFVGYVRKYHWYRIAAGKSDPEAKRQALEQLCHLEREFWASLQQNQEWATIQQENRR